MSYPNINHPEGGMAISPPAWAEELIRLAQHQLQAQNQTNQLLQDIHDKLEHLAAEPLDVEASNTAASPKARKVPVSF